jgi:uncharacterized protein with HEPN domain
MPPEKTDLKHIWDMLDAAKTVRELTLGPTLSDYEQTKWPRLATERAIEIIGEAARRVSEEFKTAHPAIEWRGIIATRHILAHEYGEIKHDKMWRIATFYVPALILQLEPILRESPPEAPTLGDPP